MATRELEVSLSTYGYIFCPKCLQYIWLGKWISEDSYGQLGFWHRPLCGEEVNSKALGELALRFIAKHLDHDIQALPEHKFERIEDEYGDRLSEIESPHTQEGPR